MDINLSRWWDVTETFVVPVVVLVGIVLGLTGFPIAYTVAISIGIALIVWNGYQEIQEGRYALDYVAFMAMVVALLTGQELPGAIVTLMFTGGKALETFASRRAEAALRSLSETIPKNAFVWRDGKFTDVPLQEIKEGEHILVKRNELVPLDGTLHSERGLLEMANLTGEAGATEFSRGVLIKSGAVNAGEIIELVVVGDFGSSTYHNIVKLVEEAKERPARFVKLSARASGYFTGTTLLFAVLGYLLGGTTSLLAVLVIATPCPLIIAAPAAFVSGMSRLARRKVIVRQPTVLEVLDRASVMFFDKTGTLTFGEPELSLIKRISPTAENLSDEDLLGIAASIEIHSLHPLARAIVNEAKKRDVSFNTSALVSERLGEGISGLIDGRTYHITGAEKKHAGITLVLFEEEVAMAEFHFIDHLKPGVADFLRRLGERGIRTEVITGDTMANAREVFGDIGIKIHADASPEDKYRLVDEAHQAGEKVVMVGDGLNDAPALARADVGIVFSGSENAASINAADIVMIDKNIERLEDLFYTSRRTYGIARQSVYAGIGLSVIGMVFAAFGFVTPVAGALVQEAIDIVVILNALRALR